MAIFKHISALNSYQFATAEMVPPMGKGVIEEGEGSIFDSESNVYFGSRRKGNSKIRKSPS
jgi:hypothetical protein